MDELKQELEKIKERNRRVEADKAWETSSARILSITLITYVVAAFLLYVVGVTNFFLAALVPAAGYYLSTLSIPIIKRWYLKTFWKEK